MTQPVDGAVLLRFDVVEQTLLSSGLHATCHYFPSNRLEVGLALSIFAIQSESTWL